MSARLAVETLAARAAARLSRLARTGGGTTLPGKLLWKLDPAAIDALAARLPQASALVSATNGKTTTAAMVAEILRPRSPGARTAPARTSSRASPRRCSPRATPSSACSRSTRARCRRSRAASARGRSCSATSSATSSTATASSSSSPSAGARPSPRLAARHDARRERRRPAGRRPRARPRRTPSSTASTTRATRGRRSSTRPTRATASAAGTPYEFAAAYVGHLGDYRCPAAATRGRRSRSWRARSSWTGSTARRSTLVTPERPTRVRAPAPGPLQRLQRARRGGARAGARRAARRDPGRARALRRRVRPLRADRRRRPAILMLLIKNPAGANEVVRTLEQGGVAAAPASSR